MTDEMIEDAEKPKQPEEVARPSWRLQAIVTSADFRSVDYNSVVRDMKSAYDSRLESAYVTVAKDILHIK